MANNKALFLNWIKNLFCIQCAVLAALVLGYLPFIGPWFKWINPIFSIGSVYCLYKLMPVNDRYHKAAVFSGIALGLTIITNLINLGLFSIVISICSLIGVYQEFYGHSEVLLTIDGRLAKKWHTLFHWNIFGSIIVAILGAPILIVVSIAFVLDENMISLLTAILIIGFNMIIEIVYLVYLKGTHDVCEQYEYW